MILGKYEIVPVISWSDEEYYAIKIDDKGFLHPNRGENSGYSIKTNPYTFSCFKNAMNKLFSLTTPLNLTSRASQL